MKRFLTLLLLAFAAVTFTHATPAMAQDAAAAQEARLDAEADRAAKIAEAGTTNYGPIGAGIIGGLALIGAGLGIGRIGSAAVESIARQPEMAGPIGTNMIIAAALVEGATLFAVVVGLLCLIL